MMTSEGIYYIIILDHYIIIMHDWRSEIFMLQTYAEFI